MVILDFSHSLTILFIPNIYPLLNCFLVICSFAFDINTIYNNGNAQYWNNIETRLQLKQLDIDDGITSPVEVKSEAISLADCIKNLSFRYGRYCSRYYRHDENICTTLVRENHHLHSRNCTVRFFRLTGGWSWSSNEVSTTVTAQSNYGSRSKKADFTPTKPADPLPSLLSSA